MSEPYSPTTTVEWFGSSTTVPPSPTHRVWQRRTAAGVGGVHPDILTQEYLDSLEVEFHDDFNAVDTTIVDGATNGSDINPTRSPSAKFSAPGRSLTGTAPLARKSTTPAAILQDPSDASAVILRIYRKDTATLANVTNNSFVASHIQTACRTGANSYEGFAQTYGVWEMEATFPIWPVGSTKLNMCWPALWLLSVVEYTGLVPARSEIDIIEGYGDNASQTQKIHAVLFQHPTRNPLPGQHKGDMVTSVQSSSNDNNVLDLSGFPAAFPNSNMFDGERHKYTGVWSPEEFAMYYDRRKVCWLDISGMDEYHFPHYMCISNQLQDIASKLTAADRMAIISPMDMSVKYATVWQDPTWAAQIREFHPNPPAVAAQATVNHAKIVGLLAQNNGLLDNLPVDHPFKAGVNPSAAPVASALAPFSRGPLPDDGDVLGIVEPSNLTLAELTSAVYYEEGPTHSDPILGYDSETGELSIIDGSRLDQTTDAVYRGYVLFNARGQTVRTNIKFTARATTDWKPTDSPSGLRVWSELADPGCVVKDGSNRIATLVNKSGYAPASGANVNLNYNSVLGSGRKPLYVPNAVAGRAALSTVDQYTLLQWNTLPFDKPAGGFSIMLSDTINRFNTDNNTKSTNFTGYDGTSPHTYALSFAPGSGGSVDCWVNGTKQSESSSVTSSINRAVAIFAVLKNLGRRRSDGLDYFMYLNTSSGKIEAFLNATDQTLTGAGRSYNGLVFDLIIYSAVTITEDFIKKVQGAQAWALGVEGDPEMDLVAKLPADHPWKAAPPQFTD